MSDAAANTTAVPIADDKKSDDATAEASDFSGRCMFEACCCAYTAVDIKNIELGCRSEENCLCLHHSFCLSVNAESLGFGLTTDKEKGEFFKIGLGFCDFGIVKPSSLCSSAASVLCFQEVCSLPCSEDYVDKFVCACCFISCAPKCGVCVEPPECPALYKLCSAQEVKSMTMDDRGEVVGIEEPTKEDVKTDDAASPDALSDAPSDEKSPTPSAPVKAEA